MREVASQTPKRMARTTGGRPGITRAKPEQRPSKGSHLPHVSAERWPHLSALFLRWSGPTPSRLGPFPWPGSAALRTCCRTGYPWSRARGSPTTTLRRTWPVSRLWARRSPRIRTLRLRSSPFPRGYVLTSGLDPIHHESASLGGRRTCALPGRPPGRAPPGSDHLRGDRRPPRIPGTLRAAGSARSRASRTVPGS